MKEWNRPGSSSCGRIDYLVRCLANPRLDRVLRARTRLISIGPPALNALIIAADSLITEVRVEVAIALGYIGDPNGLDTLLKLTCDNDDFVRYEAAWALGHIADDRAIPRLTEMASGDDPSSASAASALEKFAEQLEDEETFDENIPVPHRVRLIVSNKANWDRLVVRNMRRCFRSKRNTRCKD